jgi:hypothetical protein
MKDDTKPTLAEVARMLAEGDPPEWLIQTLEEFKLLIKWAEDDDTVERNLLRCAKYLELYLPMYEDLERFGFETPPCVDTTTQCLADLIPFLTKEVAQSSSGDPRRRLCAAVCVESYRLLHDDQLKPHSLDLRQACEDLWQACGNPTTQTAKGAAKGSDVRDNWRRSLEHAASGHEWVRSRLELYKTDIKKI